ncbi:MAG: Arc family DNA-binding protein [Calditrichaeota bacterium]|nr:Arc family DNA-binding protein [Calditrichota bacterium]MCB0306459.1 Arc family DNA-binding protein [Calditrichota bacterium]
MPAITVKNIPADLYHRLKESANLHRRSVNSEILYCLEKALRVQRIDPETFLTRIEKIQQSLSVPPLTDEFLKKAKEEGRM